MGPAPQHARPLPGGRGGRQTVQARRADGGGSARMPHPLDAERSAAPGTRPTPFPRPSTGAEPDVWALVRRAQEGDAEAFGRLYDRYVTMVHRYVYSRVGDRTTAEDVTSETFVRALHRS